MMESLRVLVTGAGGFLGGWVCRWLLERRARVVGLVRAIRAKPLYLPVGSPLFTLEPGDVRDAALWDRLLGEHSIDVVIHMAAKSQVDKALTIPREVWTSNVFGTIEAMEAARRHKNQIKAMIFPSSSRAYGPPRYLPYDEAHPLDASSPYDASKAAADLCARSYGMTYGIPVAVVRASNIYGGEDLHWERLVPEICRAFLEGRSIRLRSDGTSERDYIFIDDAIAGYMATLRALLDGRIAPGEVLNLGSGRGLSVRTVIDELIHIAGEDGRNVHADYAKSSGKIDRQAVDASRARDILGWRPEVSLRDGLRKTWNWYHSHEEELREEWLSALSVGGANRSPE